MSVELRIGDSRKLIKELPDTSIDCVMTSPPYWGLRDYGHPDQIGLEATPEEYLKTLLDFFDDVKLKLKDEGNCFVNLGDTYNGTKNGNTNAINSRTNTESFTKPKSNIPDKCLCMIPQRFAWGMIKRGWILRNEIIWAKPNHMPESVTDRLTKSHEVIYHFVKQGKYYYNLNAIREKHKTTIQEYQAKLPKSQLNKTNFEAGKGFIKYSTPERVRHNFDVGKNPGDVWKLPNTGDNNKYPYKQNNPHIQRLVSGNDAGHPNGKNPGDVWEITTQPYPESHFAVFPLELVRRPILAGCPPKGTVLDPFGGSGTVGEFCRHNDRNAILFELNPAYKPLIEDRAMMKIKELGAWA